MARSAAERPPHRTVLLEGAAAGVALGAVGIAGGATVASAAGATLAGVSVLATTLVASLLTGVWAGAPAAEEEDLPLRERWVSASLSAAVAGAVATFWGAGGATLPAVARILGLLAMVAVPAYALGLLLPVLLAHGERWEEAIEAEPRRSAGALGVGLLAGLTLSIPLAGVLLVPGAGAAPVLLTTAVLLVLPLLGGEPAAPAAREELLHETHTPVATLRVTEVVYPGDRQPERRLYLDEEQESGELVRSGAPTLAYVAAAEAWLTGTPVGASYLFLGGGAYTLPRRIAERDPRARVVVVELDPEVTRLAYRFFGLRRHHGVVSVHGDARAYLDAAAGDEFDRIYLDVYGGDEAVPYSLVTREAFERLRGRLSGAGELGLNLIGTTAGPESVRMWSVVRTAAEVFPSIALYTHLGPDFPELQNVLLLAGARLDPPGRIGLFDRWAEAAWTGPGDAPVLRDLYPTSAVRGGAAASASRPGSAG